MQTQKLISYNRDLLAQGYKLSEAIVYTQICQLQQNGKGVVRDISAWVGHTGLSESTIQRAFRRLKNEGKIYFEGNSLYLSKGVDK